MAGGGKIDLHLHSLESDGRLSPSALVELAARNGVARLALTDHDTTQGLAEARLAGRRLGVEVIAGVELSTDADEDEVHMLGLFLRDDEPEFQRRLAGFREGRIGRAQEMVERLAGLGVPVSWERVRELAGEASVGRPHVAQALLEAGHVGSMPEAFDRFLGRGQPAYVERVKQTPEQAIDLIHSVQGLAVLAHPLEGRGATHLVPRLVAAGLDGLESYYQHYDREQVGRLVQLARRHGLVPTGGSDFHGFPLSGMTSVTNEPGSTEIPPELVDELQERRRARFGDRV